MSSVSGSREAFFRTACHCIGQLPVSFVIREIRWISGQGGVVGADEHAASFILRAFRSLVKQIGSPSDYANDT